MSNTVLVKLDYDDLRFLDDSIGQNVPSDEHKTPKEIKTSDKIASAISRLAKKNNEK